MTISRIEAELIIQELVGGSSPSNRSTLVYLRDIGWTFGPVGVIILANNATPSVLNGHVFKTGGTTTITDFDDGVVEQELIILAEHSVTITDGSPIVLNGSGNYAMTTGDTLTLRMFNSQIWHEVSRSVN